MKELRIIWGKMHLFYSILRRSIDLYNTENAKDSNKSYMLSAIALSEIILGKKINPAFYKKINLIWRKNLDLKSKKIGNMKWEMLLNLAISQNQSKIFEALGMLSEFQKSAVSSGLQDRKRTWDTYAVEVD